MSVRPLWDSYRQLAADLIEEKTTTANSVGGPFEDAALGSIQPFRDRLAALDEHEKARRAKAFGMRIGDSAGKMADLDYMIQNIAADTARFELQSLEAQIRHGCFRCGKPVLESDGKTPLSDSTLLEVWDGFELSGRHAYCGRCAGDIIASA
jgi:hypothetical protein